MFKNIINYFKLVKFNHTVFAMPFALIGFFMAIKLYNYNFRFIQFFIVILCMVFARNAGMGFNRYADRYFDKKNPRTAQREIPTNKIKSTNALLFVFVNSVLFILCSYFLNKLAFILSFPALLIILFYSYTKRFTFLSHLFIGLALSIAPSAAFIAVTGTLKLPVLILSGMVLFWTAGFDVIYSLQDEEFDKKENLFSIPAKFGRKKALFISKIFHIISAGLCIIFVILINPNILNISATLAFLIMLLYQHLIINPHDISKVNLAFGTFNGLASVLFGILTVISFFI